MTIINIDFETFSAAGYRWVPPGKWAPLEGARKSGLFGVGAEVYAMHPSTRVICLDWGGRIWRPGAPVPSGLWIHIQNGGMVSAWNSQFEWWIWSCCLVPLGWPPLPLAQILDTMPRARAYGIPGSLAGAAKILGLEAQKDARGGQLIRKFCMPRNPTKNDPRMVIMAADDPGSASEFEEYCRQDVVVETAVAAAIPQLSEFEFRVWELDQQINARGVPVDVVAVDNACEILRQSARVLDVEMSTITAGDVASATKIAQLLVWANARGAGMECVDVDAVETALARNDLQPAVRQALLNRQSVASSSTKKVWAFKTRTAPDDRLYGQFVYHAAGTGRWAGFGVQPHNFPRPEAPVRLWPGGRYGNVGTIASWNGDTTDQYIRSMECRDYVQMTARWGDVLGTMSSSLRGLIHASPGHDLIASDYTAIEAVVLAVLAGEQWRVDVFNGHGKIYETSAAKITGRSLEEYAAYKEQHKSHHPDRALGKLAELASGYQGSVGAWMNFKADKFFTPERCEVHRSAWLRRSYFRRDLTLQQFAIQMQVDSWREASPMIVKFWKGLEIAANNAVRNTLVKYRYRSITYHVDEMGVLYCTLPSGRRLAYHNARMGEGKYGPVVCYDASTDKGWRKCDTYGGKLTENVVQAVARDILANGMLNVAEAGYHIVMHIHDEIICEEKHGFGSVEEIERLMGDLPLWAKGWPVRAAGGWRGKRFRK